MWRARAACPAMTFPSSGHGPRTPVVSAPSRPRVHPGGGSGPRFDEIVRIVPIANHVSFCNNFFPMVSSQKKSKTFLSPPARAHRPIHGTGELSSSSSPSDGTPLPRPPFPPLRQHGALSRSPCGKPLFLFTHMHFILTFSPENLDGHQKT